MEITKKEWTAPEIVSLGTDATEALNLGNYPLQPLFGGFPGEGEIS
ncbi:MAG: hypothetical protein AB7V55_06935 [Oscillospiraceae bacterium]